MSSRRHRAFSWWWLAAVVVLIGMAAGVWFSPFGDTLRHGDMQTWARTLQSYGWLAMIIGAGLVALQSVFPVFPYLLIAGANVLVFGLLTGFLMNWVGALLGAAVAFWGSRKLGKSWVRKHWGKHRLFSWFNRQLKRRGFLVILLVRLVPVVPPTLVNLLSGVSDIRFVTFMLATALGKLPAVYLGSVLSYDVIHLGENKMRLGIVLGILLLLAVIGYVLRKKLLRSSDDS